MTRFIPSRQPCLMRLAAIPLSGIFFFANCSARADNSIAIDHNEPVDRRIISTPPCGSERLTAGQHAAKRAEAESMVRWFIAKKLVYETELKEHLIEVSYNKRILESLKSISRSVPERSILELEKQIAVDVTDTEQLKAYIEMADADIAASRARLEFIKEECR